MKDNLLKQTIKCFSRENKFHLSIHDVSGVIHCNPALKLDPENRIHESPFCNTAKSTPKGMRRCLRCKYLSIKKALKTKSMYTGRCYLGVHEIVNPVFFNDQLICVLYLGNFIIKGSRQPVIEQINQKGYFDQDTRNLLMKVSCDLYEATPEDLEEYREIVSVLSQIITLILEAETKYKYKCNMLPIFTLSKSWIIEIIQNNIHAYFNRNLKLSQFADIYFVNPQYLCRLFKQETGMNFTAYVNRIRIEQAKSRLKLTNDSVIQIAMQAGFNNVTYFNRVFKALEGISPGEYRRKTDL